MSSLIQTPKQRFITVLQVAILTAAISSILFISVTPPSITPASINKPETLKTDILVMDGHVVNLLVDKNVNLFYDLKQTTF